MTLDIVHLAEKNADSAVVGWSVLQMSIRLRLYSACFVPVLQGQGPALAGAGQGIIWINSANFARLFLVSNLSAISFPATSHHTVLIHNGLFSPR